MEIRQHYQQAAQAAQTQQYVAYASQLTDSQSGQPAFGTPQPQQSMTIPQPPIPRSQRGPSHRFQCVYSSADDEPSTPIPRFTRIKAPTMYIGEQQI